MADPIHQFLITDILTLGEFAGQRLVLTNAAAYMVLTTVLASCFMLFAGRKLVPGRWQMLAEMLYEGIASTVRSQGGAEAMRFFPLVFTLFAFILTANLIGMVPLAFTVTSQLVVTFALAMLVFSVVTVYGFMRNGVRFFRLFMPSGVPLFLAPIIVPIEIVSYISRPISHAVRLFAVMLAGHITLKVFAGFVVSLGDFGPLGVATAILPLAMTVALTALELLMSVIQAYIFTLLTCMYLNDAIHPGH